MKNLRQYLALATLALWLSGCASSSIKQTWKSPTYQGGAVQKIAVLAVEERGLERQAFENRFVRELRGHSQDAMATCDILGLAAIKADKEAAAARVRASGADAVLIIRLVDQATYRQQLMVRPAFYNPAVVEYENSSWYDCYVVAYTDMPTDLGSINQKVVLDSSLFDVKSGRRLWSARSLTVLKEDGDRLAEADALIAKIVRAMGKDGLVRQ
jgi:hypothetical protein